MTEDLVIHHIFNKSVSNYADKVALQIKQDDRWQTFTYRQTQDLALKVGTFLLKEGFHRGDFIGLILENLPEWAIIYLGIMYAGATCVPLDTQLASLDLENIINDCQTKIIFTSNKIFTEKFNERIRAALTKIVVLDSDEEKDNLIDFSKIKHGLEENTAWPIVTPDDIASLIYTSGTTACPKGVILSQGNLCSNLKSIGKLNLCFSSDNILSILPLHHTYAFMVTLLLPLSIGAKATYSASLKSEDLFGIIEETGVTILVAVPQLFSLLHKAIFDKLKKMPFILRPLALPFIKKRIRDSLTRSLRLFVSGGARLNPALSQDLSRVGINIVEGYGLTETSPVVTINPPQKIKFGSVGLPVPDVQVKIINPDKSGIGQVLIKGPNVMQRYFKQPDLTAQVLKDGWLHSGDLGYLDKQGYLFLTSREKDVIVLSSGKNIYPEELEEYFLSQSPYIREMCILGVTEKKFGTETESLYAVIVPDFEYFRKKDEINIRGKIRWELENISKKLPSYQHIMGFCITKEELPRTPLRKIKRYQVREKYLKEKISLEEAKAAALTEEDIKILETQLAQKVINYISKELKKRVYLDSHLEIDLGIDSLSRVELGLGLEALLKIKIPDDFVERVSVVKELIINLNKLFGLAQGKEKPGFKEEKKSWSEVIKESPPEEIAHKIRLTCGLLDKLLTLAFKSVLWFIFRIFWFLRVEGKGFIPKEGPYIICPNHASYLDGFVIFSSIPFRSAISIFFLGFADIFGHPLVAWAIKVARLIPVDPSQRLIEAMQACSFVLKHKKIICIFAEGSRSISEEVQDFKKGIGILTKELDVPVIPVYIHGSHYSWPRTSRSPRLYPLRVSFGRPLNWRDLGSDYESIVRALREEVLKLSQRGTGR